MENVTKISRMFANTEDFNQSLNVWNTGNVTNMNQVFENAQSFNQDLSNWNTENVNRMKAMFAHTQSFNQSLNSWDVANVMDMESMFENAQSFNHSLENWNLNSLENAKNMLNNSAIECLNYSYTLKSWAENQNTASHISLGAASMEYSSQVEEYRMILTMDLGWTINGDEMGSCLLDKDEFDFVKIEVYPNPTKDQVYLSGLQGSESIQVFDLNGRLLQTVKAADETQSINMEAFASGVYYLKIQSENKLTTQKVIKIN